MADRMTQQQGHLGAKSPRPSRGVGRAEQKRFLLPEAQAPASRCNSKEQLQKFFTKQKKPSSSRNAKKRAEILVIGLS